jgi:uncharacterized protein (UPF0333 family)
MSGSTVSLSNYHSHFGHYGTGASSAQAGLSKAAAAPDTSTPITHMASTDRTKADALVFLESYVANTSQDEQSVNEQASWAQVLTQSNLSQVDINPHVDLNVTEYPNLMAAAAKGDFASVRNLSQLYEASTTSRKEKIAFESHAKATEHSSGITQAISNMHGDTNPLTIPVVTSSSSKKNREELTNFTDRLANQALPRMQESMKQFADHVAAYAQTEEGKTEPGLANVAQWTDEMKKQTDGYGVDFIHSASNYIKDVTQTFKKNKSQEMLEFALNLFALVASAGAAMGNVASGVARMKDILDPVSKNKAHDKPAAIANLLAAPANIANGAIDANHIIAEHVTHDENGIHIDKEAIMKTLEDSGTSQAYRDAIKELFDTIEQASEALKPTEDTEYVYGS